MPDSRDREQPERAAQWDALSNCKMLELFITTLRPGLAQGAQLAHALYARFGSLHNLLDAHAKDLLAIPGMDAKTVGLLTMVAPLAKRCYLSRWERDRFDRVLPVCRYCVLKLCDERNEKLYLLCLDEQYRLLHSEIICEGTLEGVILSSRRIIECALRYDARRIVIAHNHPTGEPTPSRADYAATAKVIRDASVFGLQVIDHIVTVGTRCYSCYLHRELSPYEQNTAELERACYREVLALQ